MFYKCSICSPNLKLFLIPPHIAPISRLPVASLSHLAPSSKVICWTPEVSGFGNHSDILLGPQTYCAAWTVMCHPPWLPPGMKSLISSWRLSGTICTYCGLEYPQAQAALHCRPSQLASHLAQSLGVCGVPGRDRRPQVFLCGVPATLNCECI